MSGPILYSFRRCPYAMRARMALLFGGCEVVIREIELKRKPQAMLEASPKGTVPVLVFEDGRVLEESVEIMQWALDGHAMLEVDLDAQMALVHHQDTAFKPWLDRYKYHVRYPEQTKEIYRMKGELFLQAIEDRLKKTSHLFGDRPTLSDLAIFPFIRQFMFVDKTWFDQAPYPHTRAWLQDWLTHKLFVQAMYKYSPWREDDDQPTFFGGRETNDSV